MKTSNNCIKKQKWHASSFMKKAILRNWWIAMGTFLIVTTLFAAPVSAQKSGNPVFPGYNADPDVQVVGNAIVILTTGFRTHTSTDLINWTKQPNSFPTKPEDAPGSRNWAPSVSRYGERYFAFITSSVYVGDSPIGPFYFVPSQGSIGTGIDAHGFVDDDGKMYLYSGNTKLIITEFEKDLEDKAIVKSQTIIKRNEQGLTEYFEGPYMIKRNGIYYIMYSSSNWRRDLYNVRYATATNPKGPFTYGGQILKSDQTHKGPGHHSVFKIPGKDEWYIVYHRYNTTETGLLYENHPRVTCIDRMYFDTDGKIKTVTMTDEGVDKHIFPASAMKVTSMSLMDATTDKDIKLKMSNGDEINLDNPINIRANVYGLAGSVRFTLDGENYETDNNPPYSIGGDDGAKDFNSWTLGSGEHTITVTPYTGQNGTGEAGQSLSITFTVIASDGGGNISPTASITSPSNNSSFDVGTAINLSANANDADGSITKVEFYANGSKIGEDASSPYSLSWSGILAGTNTLVAVATDNQGGKGTSATVDVIGEGDLAYPVIHSVSEESSDATADGLIDGDFHPTNGNARWSADGMPQWVIIDYGEVKSITGTRLFTYNNRAYKYKVEMSEDLTFNEPVVVNRLSNTDGSQPISDDFGAVSARYVKITVTGASGYSGDWVSLIEFEIEEGTGSIPAEVVRLQNVHSNLFIRHDTEGRLYMESRNNFDDSYTTVKWELEDASDGYVRLKNIYSAKYLRHKDGELFMEDRNNFNDDYTTVKWKLEEVNSNIVRLQNVHSEMYLRNKDGNLFMELSENFESHYTTVQWKLEATSANSRSEVTSEKSTLESTGKNDIVLYPNPVTNGMLKIEGLAENATIRVYSIVGTKLLEKQASGHLLTLNLPVTTGAVLISISQNDTITWHKVIVE